ncbi:MAG: hypothetical protein HY296_08120 [Thaumarchaeota archaeon]|nr:hypothetical protein [Nitrososphaerota archaeon]
MIPKGTSVTLVEPKYPVNVGHVARLVKNFGVRKLYLVSPMVDISVAAVYASHASDILDSAEVASLEQVRSDNELLIATTAVRANRKSNIIRRSLTPDRLHEALSASAASSIIFGRDSTGLTNEEIGMCDMTVTIDVGTKYRALNLGHAVAIMLYCASRGPVGRAKPQSREAREVFAGRFYELARVSKVRPHKLKTLYEAGKRIASTSRMTDGQLNLMSGTFDRAVAAIEAQTRDSKT